MTALHLIDQVRDCCRCAHGSTRTQVVVSRGDPLSTICFVGEAPGEEEDTRGLPFVGQSGILLDKQIDAMRNYAASIGVAFPVEPYICNVIKCRPAGNTLLKDGSDVAACSEWLWQQLFSLPNLRAIVALGRTASLALLGITSKSTPSARATTMAWLRRHANADPPGGMPNAAPGLPSSYALVKRGVRVWPTYHPSYLLRQPNNKDLRLETWTDLKRAVDALK